jgi:hypothetical protein
MTVRTQHRGAAVCAGAIRDWHTGARPAHRSFSKPWLSLVGHKPIPHCKRAMDCGAPSRDVRIRAAVSLPGSKFTLSGCTGEN